MLPKLETLNLTCSLVTDSTMCDKGLYQVICILLLSRTVFPLQYESPLDPALLSPLVNLVSLDISLNGLTAWSERRFQNNPKLRRLNIGYNKFKSLTVAMLEDFRQLVNMDLLFVFPLSTSVNIQEFLDIRMQENDFVLCNQEVVRFYDWATAQDNNITIEDWDGGEEHSC